GRRLLNFSAGLLAAGMLAVSPLAIELSNEARTYALVQLLAIVSTLFFLRWLDRRRPLDLALYVLTVVLACYSHYYAFALPVAHGLCLFVSAGWRGLIPWIGAMALAALLWVPWLPQFAAQVGGPGNLSRMGNRWYLQFPATPAAFGVGRSFAWRDS